MNLAQVQTVWDNKQMDCASLNVKGKLNKPKGTASMDCNHIGLVRTYHSFVIKSLLLSMISILLHKVKNFRMK